jgi:hypothetical protein
MSLRKSILFGAMCLVATTLVAKAQAPYPAYQAYPNNPPPRSATPPSWSYDPYTSGQAPCPQRMPGDTQTCQQQMPPTYGQPSYWPTR